MRLGLDLRLTYYTRGGIARYTRRLAERLPMLAAPHTHLHFYRRGHTETFAPQAHRVECRTPAHHRWETVALGVELLPHRLDLFHSPDFIPPRFGARRFVITVHDLAFLRYPQFLTAESRRYYNGQIASAVRRAHAISADSHATKADLVNLLGAPPEKITVIPLGLDAHFHPRSQSEVAATLARFNLLRGYVLFVGTFEPRKNVPALLQACAQLRARWQDAPPLVLVGNTGWLFEETMRLAHELKLDSHLHRLENVPEADLPALYCGAGVCVLPSHYEGFGFPVLEAMGCGTPVIYANISSLPEVAGQAGLPIDPNDVDALAEAIHRALTDSGLRADLIERGLAQAKTFTWDKTARATLALYESVLA
ncbi:MAG: glycosyltransferase family 4 protein [Anaerolineales bacterium]|nr:glycosyltransferase family 4 protein [Anaerolineales bacterium]